MNPYLKSSLGNTNPPYDDATINKFNTASSSALGYLQNRLNDPIYYKRLQNEIIQSNKLGNVTYDPKTGALDLLNQRKKGLNEVKFINPNTTNQSEIAIINDIKNKEYLGAFTTGQTGRYEPEYQREGFMKGALKQDIAGFQKNVIGVNPVMFNQDYEKYLENILIHEGEHSTQPAYPGYTNPYYNVGMMNVDNGTLPLYRNLSNITPYATNVIKENILSNDEYYSDPMEVVASKRQIEHLFEKAPEGTFKKTWKYGDEIQDEHFNYFLKGNNNTETNILKKSLLGDRTIDELNEEEKKDLKLRFSNIMTKIAYNENNNDNIYTARFGTQVNDKNKTNPYLKKYGPGGETDPYDPTTSYIRPKKVNVDGKEMSTYSNEYRNLYNTGNIMPVYEGLPSMYGPEVEVTAEAPEWLKEKRRIEAQGRIAESVRKGTGSFARPILETGLELSGVPGAVRFSKDPIKNLQGTANILSYTNVPGLIGHGINYAMGNPFFNVTEEDWQGLANTADVAGLATLGVGTALKLAPKAVTSIPRILGKIPDVNPNIGLRFADETIEANKALSTKQRQVVPQTTQSIPKEYTPWTQQEMPGLHLQSTMSQGPISRIIEPKTGLINVEQALGIIGKESGGADKVSLIKQGLGESIPKKMDYNEFRKVVQDQLIPLERQFSSLKSNYGIERLGYGDRVGSYYLDDYGNIVNTPGGKFSKPLENQTLILSNKSKFGRGSSAHDNPDETLGHIHFLRDTETPDVLTVTQIQSDAFQGPYRIMPKTFNKEQQLRSLAGMEDIAKRQEELVRTAKQIDSDTWKLSDGSIVDKSVIEQMGKGQSEINALKKAEIENFIQKSLLDKNHQERYLQELIDYAAKRGDVNKVRLPTSETAAKVQNYTPIKESTIGATTKKQLDESSTFEDFMALKKDEIGDYQLNDQEINAIKKIYTDYKTGNLKEVYDPAHTTILKKYSEQPKTIKKLFGIEPKIVTDSKGNTWYEFDIPQAYKQGKGEIKAFSMPGIIGAGAAGVGANEMMKQIPQNRYGGQNPYIKYANKGPVDPVDPEEENKIMQNQINSILSGKPMNTGITMTRLSPNEESTYQEWVKGLTPNLKGSAEDKNYDMRGAWKVGEQPELFYYDNNKFMSAHPIDVNQQGSIYEPHLFSRNPFTGKSLKGPYHTSFMHAIEGDIKSGGKVKMDLKTGDMYTYEKGGKVDLPCPPYCNNDFDLYEKYQEEENKRDPYNPNNKKIVTEGKKTKPINQTLGYNIFEYLDPTGISSYPDVANSWNDNKYTYNDIVEPLGAIPVFGKIPKTIKGISKGINIFDAIDDIYNDNLRPILKKIPDMDPLKNFPPENYGPDDYKTGGDTGYSTVEIERSERVYTPDGKLIMETPADAPTHEEGGVKVSLPAGSLVFPKKYYKALDAASGLPEFKKIAKTMLDNAEKAYLRGEPYSSGGKRNKERTYNA